MKPVSQPVYGITYAPYATDPRETRGRLHREPEAPDRTAFQRDRDRIIHSAAFRRLKHKTQVFVSHEGDHYRTRLTHSLEVSQIARTLSRSLGLNEDLAEALALAHDLGHTPFGHAGEEALDEAMGAYGGFDHNAQTLRILTRLERKYADFDGLNLTWECLEGVVKHNGPLTGEGVETPVPEPIRDYVAQHDLELHTHPGPEAQVAALSDDIAYNNHDIDDGLRAGLFAVGDVAEVPLVGETIRQVRDRYGEIDPERLIHEVVRRLISRMVGDLREETLRRLREAKPSNAADIRALPEPVAAFSDRMRAAEQELKAFLFERMYRHHKVNRMTSKARRIVTDLFRLFIEEPGVMPDPWGRTAAEAEPARAARLVSDYIAGMTDRFALNEHHRLFDSTI